MFRYVSNGKQAFLDEKISLGYTVFPRIIAVSRLITSLEKSPPFNGTNNRLPRILAAPPTLSPSSVPFPLPVKLKCNVIQQNWSVMIQALKINQGI